MNSVMNFCCRFGTFCLIITIGVGCAPEQDDPGANGNTHQPTLVTNLNGYRYEGTFNEVLDPVQFQEPVIWHIEEYGDSIRLIFTTYDTNLERYRWTIQSLYKGKVNRQFEGAFGVTNPHDFRFAFNHETFQLYGYDTPNSYVTIFTKNTPSSGFYLSKPNNNFPYSFSENYTVFFGSASSIYSYENKFQKYTAPAPTIGYVLTSESSVAWADHILNDDALSATLFREEIITCFFNATLDKFNYIGIAKGQQTLDTLVVNANNPSIYYPVSFVYASVTDNKVYLGLKKKKGPSMPDDISLYEMDLTEKIIRPVFKNIDAPNSNISAFVRGKFYFSNHTKVMNNSGQLEDIPSPTLAAGAGISTIFFGKTRVFFEVRKNFILTELYSRPY
jgi:hypothetical protein